MIEALSDMPPGILGFVCRGTVTGADYETVLAPAVEAAARTHGGLRLYYEIGPDVTGFDAGAMWQDVKVGMGHLFQWQRVAVVTDHDWIRHAVSAFRPFLPGAVRVFAMAETADARAWVAG